MQLAYNRFIQVGAVAVDTTAGGKDLLTSAQQATPGMQGVLLTPTADMYLGGVAADGTALDSTNGIPLYAGITYDLAHTAGPLRAITASGSTTCRVTLGCY